MPSFVTFKSREGADSDPANSTLSEREADPTPSLPEGAAKLHQKVLDKGLATQDELGKLHDIAMVNSPGLESRLIPGNYRSQLNSALALKQRGADLNEIQEIAKRYPGALSALTSRFKGRTLEVERLHTKELQRIYSSVPEDKRAGIFYDICPKRFIKAPEAITQMFEQYGTATPGIIDLFRATSIQEERIHREALKKISAATERNKYALSELPIEALREYPDEMIAIARYTGGNASRTYAHMPLDELDENAAGVVAIAQHWGELTGSIFSLCSGDVVSNERRARHSIETLLDAIKDAGCESWSTLILSDLSLPVLERHVNTISDLTRLAFSADNPLSPDRLRKLCKFVDSNPAILENCAPMLCCIARSQLTELADQISVVPMELIHRDPELLYEIALATRGQVKEIFQHLDVELALSHRDEILEIIHEYGSHAGGLCKAFGSNLIDGVSTYRGEIFDAINRYHEGASAFFGIVPPEHWDASAHFDFDSATPKVLQEAQQNSRLSFHIIGSVRSLVGESRRQFNITNLHRYLAHSEGEELLSNNLRNLDPEFEPERPIILYGIAQDDCNTALQNGVTTVLQKMSEKSRLIFFELSSGDDLVVQAIRASSLFGHNARGKPNQACHAVFVAAHASSSSALLAKRSVFDVEFDAPGFRRPGNNVLGMAHTELYREVGATIEQGGYFGIFGCCPGKRVDGRDSLIDRVAHSMPHLNVLGATKVIVSEPSRPSHLVHLAQNGKVSNIDMSCGAENILHFAPRESHHVPMNGVQQMAAYT